MSDIYGPDEIEELLQDLNKLEMSKFDSKNFETVAEFENVDNFDIDGSRLDGLNLIPDSCPGSPGAMSTRWWLHEDYRGELINSFVFYQPITDAYCGQLTNESARLL